MTQSSNEVAGTPVAHADTATRIGRLYRKGRESLVLAGQILITQKESMSHGEWLPWLKVNADELGFGWSTAKRLMKLANSAPGAPFDLWGHNTRGTQGTGENEWHTPVKYIELARLVLGEIDLDPATSRAAQKTVKAAKFFTKAEDGLQREWHGRVWMNPPYAQPLISEFVDKIIAERNARRVVAAITLTHNYTDTGWCQDLAMFCDALCFTRGRIRFESPTGELAAPTQGQVFAYFGSDREKFMQTFAPVGFLMVRA